MYTYTYVDEYYIMSDVETYQAEIECPNCHENTKVDIPRTKQLYRTYLIIVNHPNKCGNVNVTTVQINFNQ